MTDTIKTVGIHASNAALARIFDEFGQATVDVPADALQDLVEACTDAADAIYRKLDLQVPDTGLIFEELERFLPAHWREHIAHEYPGYIDVHVHPLLTLGFDADDATPAQGLRVEYKLPEEGYRSIHSAPIPCDRWWDPTACAEAIADYCHWQMTVPSNMIKRDR